jgi:hypothetical protein
MRTKVRRIEVRKLSWHQLPLPLVISESGGISSTPRNPDYANQPKISALTRPTSFSRLRQLPLFDHWDGANEVAQ